MRLSSLRYALKPENIATEPREMRLGRRDLSRMLVVDRMANALHDSYVTDLGRWINPGDVLVLNNSKRLPGVLKARVDGKAKVDIRLVNLVDEFRCIASIYPTHFIKPGARLHLADKQILLVEEAGIGPHKLFSLRGEVPISQSLMQVGLPITSFFYSNYWDIDHYNPVYADRAGAVESPMAGLHFTDELLASLRENGVVVCFITLHVVGSWLPPLGDNTDSYAVYAEPYEIDHKVADAIMTARASGNRVIAVGSTTVRALESCALAHGSIVPFKGDSTLFISPGHELRAVDAYFTNFHPAQSGLMALDATLCELKLLLKAYEYANDHNYLFLEFGDAVLYI